MYFGKSTLHIGCTCRECIHTCTCNNHYVRNYRVRPKVHVSDPTPSRGRKHHHSVITSHHSHSSPLSLSHVTKLGKPIAVTVGPCIKDDGVRRGRESVRGDGARREGVRRDGVMVKKSVGQLGLTRRGEDMLRGAVTESQRKETTCRFPDVLMLPPLVSYIHLLQWPISVLHVQLPHCLEVFVRK